MSSNNSEWVSLRAAADILGVHPATVRNWADKGELPSRRTPGGHRRFRRSDLLKHADTNTTEERQPGEVQIVLQNALGQARMQVDGLANVPWYAAMSESTRKELREQGRHVLEAMRTYLNDGDADKNLAAAIRLGSDYAQHIHGDGLTLPQAMRGFFYFNNFVLDAILTWSELRTPKDSSEWAGLLRQVNDFANAMLLSIVEYYEDD